VNIKYKKWSVVRKLHFITFLQSLIVAPVHGFTLRVSHNLLISFFGFVKRFDRRTNENADRLSFLALFKLHVLNPKSLGEFLEFIHN